METGRPAGEVVGIVGRVVGAARAGVAARRRMVEAMADFRIENLKFEISDCMRGSFA
jgi:hypothetical protein